MIATSASRALAALSLACCLAAPAWATRDIQVDVPARANTLTPCSSFAGCLSLDLSLQNSGAVQSVTISPTGFIEFRDDGGGVAYFAVGESTTTYQVLSGSTLSPSLGRIDFVSFYAPGSSIADFQIQFREVGRPGITNYPTSFFNDLEIAFAYNNPVAGGANRVAPGATIGYRGGTLGVQQATGASGMPGTFAGFPAQQLITNSDGLLLGEEAGDSDFAFVVGNYPNTSYSTVVGLVSQTFAPRYAATAPVPEPATWSALLLGLFGIGARLRRRRAGGTAALA